MTDESKTTEYGQQSDDYFYDKQSTTEETNVHQYIAITREKKPRIGDDMKSDEVKAGEPDNGPTISRAMSNSQRCERDKLSWWTLQKEIETEILKYKDPKKAARRLQEISSQTKDGIFRAMQMTSIDKRVIEIIVSHPDSKRHGHLTYTDTTTTRRNENVIHAAILSGDEKNVHILCEELKKPENEQIRKEILHTKAESRDRSGTVMEGELPLSVAALKLNKKIVEYLLRLGADVLGQNSHGNNVIHSLIKYASVKPEKIMGIRDMIGFIHTWTSNNISKEVVNKLFLMENFDNLSPLKFAVVNSVSELCAYLLSLKGVYLKVGKQDGIHERKIYDITTLDSFTNRHAKAVENQLAPSSSSVIELIFTYTADEDTTLAIVKHEIVSYMIKLKWKAYFWIFLFWILFHLTTMAIITAYTVVRVDFFFLNDTRVVSGVLNGDTEHDFVTVAFWLILVLAFVYVVPIALYIFSKSIAKAHPLKHLGHNIDYSVLYTVFVVGIFIDAIFLGGSTSSYHGEALTFSVICGWLFSTIFLRPLARCGHLTVLVRRVIIRDVLGFVLVFLFLLIAFAACLHDLLKYKEDEEGRKILVEEFSTFSRALFTMFNAMLGLTDITDIFGGRASWLAVVLLITFLLITYAFLVNALIGIITSTCEEIFNNKQGYMNVHRLSVLLFMEEFFALYYLFDPIGEETYGDKEEKDPVCYTLELKSEASLMTDDSKTIAKEKEENLRLRDVVLGALQVSENVIYGYKCLDCKRREMIITANKNAVDLNITQRYLLDSEGRPIAKSVKGLPNSQLPH